MIVTQTEFRRALLDARQTAPEGLRDGFGGPAGRRFDVYRNNVTVSLTDALESAFPTVAKVLGEENFRAVAGFALRAHPPRSPLLMEFGEAFPAFLAGFGPLSHLGYLADVARLDHAMRLSYHAADSAPVAAEALAALAPDRLPGARLRLAPSVSLLRSAWPIHGIWRFNHEDGAPQPHAMAEDVLVTRPEYDPIPRRLPPGAAAFLASALQGDTLGEALDAALNDAPGFDLAPILSLLIRDGCITELE